MSTTPPDRAPGPGRTRTPAARRTGLALLLGAAGVTHLVRPEVYEPMVPRSLGPARPWVVWSGVAEIACAAGLLHPRTRPLAARATALLFVAVFPANVQMAATALRSEKAGRGYTAATLARLPLQVPLVRWALRVARESQDR